MRKYFVAYLRRCARKRIKRHSPYIIGITWSVWKTSCRMILTWILWQLLPDITIRTSSKNFNTEIGLALSILDIDTPPTSKWQTILLAMKAFWKTFFVKENIDVLVLEYGIDAPWDMDWLVSVCQPHAAILTALDLVHAHQLAWPDEILAEKSKLLLSSRETTFYPSHLQLSLKPYVPSISWDVLSFAAQQEDVDSADIWRNNRQYIKKWSEQLPRVSFDVVQWVDSVITVETNLLWKESAGYCSIWVELAMILSRRLWTPLVEPFSPISFSSPLQAWRFAVYAGRWWSMLVDSTYNAAPKSMAMTIENVIRLRNSLYKDFDLIYCLGDMRELGDFEEQEHRRLARLVSQSADAVYLVWTAMKSYMTDELEKLGYNMHNVQHCVSSPVLGETLAKDLPDRARRALVLFKWSQNTIFLEEALPYVADDSFDRFHLPRQSATWLKKKTTYFDSL